MRSNLITVITAVASTLLVAGVTSADDVQEQLRLMEQRMAEMEDRLQATSDELRSARETVDEQQEKLTDAGLLDGEDGLRSAAGSFFEQVDVSGVAAASYNQRLVESETFGNLAGGNLGYFKNPNSNTFQVDQIWLTLDKAPTDESRGGFHAEFATGTSTQNQGANNGNPDVPYLYSGYASYLAPVGNGVQIDVGKLGTVLGAEVVQTNGNYFITQGSVFGLQPVTYNGVSIATPITDELGFVAGVVNDVYSDTDVSINNDKAYFGQLSYGGETFGLNVGGIIGNNQGACAAARGTGDCTTSVVDVVLTADPTESLSLWANYDWVHTSGTDTAGHGDQHGVSGAGRLALGDTMGIATRAEYIWSEDTVNNNGVAGADDDELFTLTGTFDKTLAEGLVTRIELRWDKLIEGNGGGPVRTDGGRTGNDQLVAFWQLYYEF
jgi:hypothetical protein